MRVLITGARGYVGSSISSKLSERDNGVTVHTLTRDVVDLRDGVAVNEWFRDKEFDVVLHAATVGGIKLSDINAKNQKYIHSEYLPALAKINNISRGVKLLMTAQAIQEGFYPGARAYRTKNPGNIGNTDSGVAGHDLGSCIRVSSFTLLNFCTTAVAIFFACS